jgi:Ricin-type beta-trefoil lectin domain-like
MRRKILALIAAVLVGIGAAAVVASPASAFSGAYNIKPYGTSKCLDVTGVSYADGAPIQLYDCLGGTQYNQSWYLVGPLPGSINHYQIKAGHSFKCLDVTGASQDPGARLQQYDCLGTGQLNQVFLVASLGGDKWYIAAIHSNQSVSYQGLFNGAAVFQWPAIVEWAITQ